MFHTYTHPRWTQYYIKYYSISGATKHVTHAVLDVVTVTIANQSIIISLPAIPNKKYS